MSLLPLPLKLCVGGVFCCSVLALHLLWLATLHRRSRPTVLSGELDFAATLLGLGGFFAVGVTAWASFAQAWVAGHAVGSVEATWGLVTRQQQVQLLAVGVYGAVVAGAAAVGFWTRRNSLEVHHIDPAAVPGAVEAAAAEVGLGATPAVAVSVRPAAAHATVRVRRLDPVATAELLAALTARLAAAPPPARPGDARYTLAACGLLGVTLALFVAFFRYARLI